MSGYYENIIHYAVNSINHLHTILYLAGEYNMKWKYFDEDRQEEREIEVSKLPEWVIYAVEVMYQDFSKIMNSSLRELF